MRIIKIPIGKIEYETKDFDESLLASIERIGLSFCIKVNVLEDGYQCVDGHKRLTILNILNVEEVNAIVLNDGSSRSNDCSRSRNSH